MYLHLKVTVLSLSLSPRMCVHGYMKAIASLSVYFFPSLFLSMHQLMHTLSKKYLCVSTTHISRTENTNLRVCVNTQHFH